MTRLLDSIPYEGMKNGTHLDIEVSYNKDGFGSRRRGFYLSVTPVTRNGIIKSVVLPSGAKVLIAEAARYTQKQFDRAVVLSHSLRDDLIALVLTQERAA